VIEKLLQGDTFMIWSMTNILINLSPCWLLSQKFHWSMIQFLAKYFVCVLSKPLFWLSARLDDITILSFRTCWSRSGWMCMCNWITRFEGVYASIFSKFSLLFCWSLCLEFLLETGLICCFDVLNFSVLCQSFSLSHTLCS
jgi:hypothetical protein